MTEENKKTEALSVAKSEASKDQPEAQTPDGVFVQVKRDNEGNISVDTQTIGDTRVTEIPILLEMAGKRFRIKAGLDK